MYGVYLYRIDSIDTQVDFLEDVSPLLQPLVSANPTPHPIQFAAVPYCSFVTINSMKCFQIFANSYLNGLMYQKMQLFEISNAGIEKL